MNTTIKPSETKKLLGGQQRLYKFANGFGASVVRHHGSYGHESQLWELAILHGPTQDILYKNRILPEGVKGWLDEDEVQEYLQRIKNLKARQPALTV